MWSCLPVEEATAAAEWLFSATVELMGPLSEEDENIKHLCPLLRSFLLDRPAYPPPQLSPQICGSSEHRSGICRGVYIDCPSRPCGLCGLSGHTAASCPFGHHPLTVGEPRAVTVAGGGPAGRASLARAVAAREATSTVRGCEPERGCLGVDGSAWRLGGCLIDGVPLAHGHRVSALAALPFGPPTCISGDESGELAIWNVCGEPFGDRTLDGGWLDGDRRGEVAHRRRLRSAEMCSPAPADARFRTLKRIHSMAEIVGICPMPLNDPSACASADLDGLAYWSLEDGCVRWRLAPESGDIALSSLSGGKGLLVAGDTNGQLRIVDPRCATWAGVHRIHRPHSAVRLAQRGAREVQRGDLYQRSHLRRDDRTERSHLRRHDLRTMPLFLCSLRSHGDVLRDFVRAFSDF